MEPIIPAKPPLISQVPPKKREGLLRKKLELCSEIHDHSFLKSNPSSKSLLETIKCGEAPNQLVQNLIRISYKVETLQELLHFIVCNNPLVTEERIREVKDMIASNMFRSFPSPSAFLTEKTMDESDNMAPYDPNLRKPLYETSWETLRLIYQLLRKIIDARLLLDKHIDDGFLVNLFNIAIVADDSREAVTVTELLHLFWERFSRKRRLIWTTVKKNLSRFVTGYRSYIPSAVSNLLSFAGFRVFEFCVPLEQENIEFLRRVLIPLHRTNAYPLYCESLEICLGLYLDKDTELINLMFEGIMGGRKRVPSGRLCQVTLLDEIKYLMTMCLVEVITESAAKVMFRHIAGCLADSREEVALKAFEFVTWRGFIEFAIQHKAVFYPIIIPALGNAAMHRDITIAGEAARIRQMYDAVENDAESQFDSGAKGICFYETNGTETKLEIFESNGACST